MKLLHDAKVRDDFIARVQRLTPNATPRWGKMSVDQMLWHCNRMLANTTGEFQPPDMDIPIPRWLAKWIVMVMPFPKGRFQTQPAYLATGHYAFDEERAKCLRLIREISARDIDSKSWGRSAPFGDMTGREWSRLNAKHLEHHLRQFGV